MMPALQQWRGEEQEFGAILSYRVSLRPCLKNESWGPSPVTVKRRDTGGENYDAAGHYGSPVCSSSTQEQEGLLQGQGQLWLHGENL